jgi:hypothetical protein
MMILKNLTTTTFPTRRILRIQCLVLRIKGSYTIEQTPKSVVVSPLPRHTGPITITRKRIFTTRGVRLINRCSGSPGRSKEQAVLTQDHETMLQEPHEVNYPL